MNGKTLAALTAIILMSSLASAQITVTLSVVGFHNNNGDLLLGVFNDESQFPFDPFLEYEWPKDTLKGNTMVVEFSVPEPGKYALSLMDDENSSGDMDKNFIGYPTEHYGFSNDIHPGLFKPPSYNSCLVEITGAGQKLIINLQK